MEESYRYGAVIDCNTRYKFYGDEVRISVFSRDIFKTEAPERARIIQRGNATPERRGDSLARARDKVFDISFSNHWNYFVTLTLDRKKIDRVDYDEIRKAFKVWTSNLVQRHSICYLAVAELHKKPIIQDGKVLRAVHFHLLLSDIPARYLKDSGKTDKKGNTIYNLTNWQYGFTTAIKTYGSKEATAKYLTKYLTKDIAGIYGKSYWSGGKGLIRDVPTTYGHEDYTTAAGQEYKIAVAHLGIKYRREDL